MKRELIEKLLEAWGWEKDRWGNYKLEHWRFHFKKRAVRLEEKRGGMWMKLAGEFYGKMEPTKLKHWLRAYDIPGPAVKEVSYEK